MSPIFQAGGALRVDHPSYVERQADYEALRAARDGEYLHVIAPRQVGKTSLLKRLATRLGEMSWRCAYMDLSTLMDFSKSAWYAELGRVLAHSLTPGRPPALANQIDLRNYLLNHALPWPGGQPRIALFLDEVEGAGKARDTDGALFSDTFFSMFRALYNERDKLDSTLVVALAGTVDPSALVTDPAISPFNVGREIGLDDFTLTQMRELTGHLADLGLPVDETIHQAIYEWTNGHPYLTQRICAELEKSARSGDLTAITPDHVGHIVEQVILSPANPLQRDKNLRHVAKMLGGLSAPATEAWSRFHAGESVSLAETGEDLYLELYLTGAVKAQADLLVIRNRIYERSLIRQRLDYDVALSFAGEDRATVRQVYEALTAAGIKTFYDEDEDVKAELWGKNLYDYLLDLYRKRAKYCIIFVSRDYARKVWPNHERQAAQARALLENREYILPLRLDDTEIPGLLPTIAYLDLRYETVAAVVECVRRKLDAV
ncbi:MAG: TIR domain-containing protein [Chloroflexi bacterium]|nr:TIR domain-containing protein [Chloroflexota bacterium]